MRWDMFLVSLVRPTRKQEDEVIERGLQLGFNYSCPGASKDAPPLPQAATQDGWWAVDHERVRIGYGRKAYREAKELVGSWQHFQLPWAQVRPDTPTKAGSPVCVVAQVAFPWTAVPLQVVYRQEGRFRQPVTHPDGSGSSAPMRGRRFSFACGCLGSHFLAGEERFSVEWDWRDDSVWFDIYTFSRPAHPLAALGYPVVRYLQARFRSESSRSLARQMAVQVVEGSLDESIRKRLVGPEDALQDEGAPAKAADLHVTPLGGR